MDGETICAEVSQIKDETCSHISVIAELFLAVDDSQFTLSLSAEIADFESRCEPPQDNPRQVLVPP